MAQAKTTNTPFIDAFGVAETFATELVALENLGPCYRLLFTVPQTNYKGETELAPVIKLILPAEALQQMLVNLPMLMRNLPGDRPSYENAQHLN